MARRANMIRSTSIVLVLTVAGGLAAGVFASPKRADATSCPPVPQAQLHSIFGLPNSLQTRNDVDDSAVSVRYQCNSVAWRGSAPTSPQAAFQLARNGRGAGFGIETWARNDDGSSADEWPKQYDELTGGFDIAAVNFPGFFTNPGWPSKLVTPVGLGYLRTGGIVMIGSGPAKGLVAAVGCWWDDSALTAACLFVEEAKGKPVLTHLDALAKIAIPKVL